MYCFLGSQLFTFEICRYRGATGSLPGGSRTCILRPSLLSCFHSLDTTSFSFQQISDLGFCIHAKHGVDLSTDS